MIKVCFFGDSPCFGFHITGHSDYSESGSDIVCAAVSSAAYMTANTVTEIIGLAPEIEVGDGEMLLKLKTESEAEKCRVILDGLMLHLFELQKQYKNFMKVNYSEV